MQNQLCSVCLDYIQEPKCLPCLHVVCFSCLKKLSQQQNRFNKQPTMELLQLLLLSCPICRHKFVTKENCVAAFPPPKVCIKCQNYVGQVVEMCCGHRNDNVCLDCLICDVNKRISCPDCGKHSTKTMTRRMFLCHVCHTFYPATCKVCPPTLMKETSSLGLSRYSVQSVDENADQHELHRVKYISFIIVVIVVGILFAMYCLELDWLRRRNFDENTCCSITVWHVDSWGNVDTTWCSGDDWKMLYAKCAIWPP